MKTVLEEQIKDRRTRNELER